jgi:DNA topoisomerase II
MNKSIEETYSKKDLYNHIKDLPDSYIGSLEKAEAECWILEDGKVVNKNIQYVPGLYKIYDEIIVNAIDQFTRLDRDNSVKDKVTMIKVNIDKETNTISVYNNGKGMPVEIHKKEKVYVPQMIFSVLLTSSNYDKNEKKYTGGKNGFGAKLTNIFSTEFIVETVDADRKKKFIQHFSNNMLEIGEPKVTKYSGKPYTKITFKPDLKNFFNMEELEDDMIGLMERRVIDVATCTGKSVSVYLNDSKINCPSLDKYVNYYFEEKVEKLYSQSEDGNWELCVVINPEVKFQQMSFVNGIHTVNGGQHVDAVCKHINRKILNVIKKKGYKRKKDININGENLKSNMFIFLRSMIVNPSFKGQIKEILTTAPKDFGSKYVMDDKEVEKLMKTSLVDRAIKMGDMKKEMNLVQLTDNKRRVNTLKIPKLDDANKAGSTESLKCTLMLTEGDSAKTLAVAGLSVVGRDYFGVFPLKGKPLNVRDTKLEKILKNDEISNLLKILGLSVGMLNKIKDKEKKVKLLKEKLRYGRVMIFTDQDVDGSHIKGLVINVFHTLFPELKYIDEFIISLATPIVKITNKKNKKESKDFYTLTEYEDWKKTVDLKKWGEAKYYKGLGTSTTKEGKSYFTDFENRKIIFKHTDDEEVIDISGKELKVNKCDNAISLAFSSDKKEERKEWLRGYDRNNIVEQSEKVLSYDRFINNELIHFSNYSCERAIPSICDGLKPTTRKVLYSALKRNLKKEIKVAQFAGYVSENASYHHGEKSLNECIIGMAQNFVGSNNIELLVPNGQFGSRLLGGKDAAAPRYIFTKMNDITPLIYHPDDYPLMKYNEDDGYTIEPEFYVPILPMILVNGTRGIGTGFSTNIPSHNPLEIIDNIYNLMDDKDIKLMKPWFRGFEGEVSFNKVNDYGYDVYSNKGKYVKLSDTKIQITELPIGLWTENYKEYLESLVYDKSADEKAKKKQCIVSVDNNSTETKVNFTITFKQHELFELMEKNKLEKILKLSDETNSSYTNMYLYNERGILTKYDSAEKILKEFYLVRLAYYIKRKEYLLMKLKREIDIYKMKIKFIKEFISKEIVIIEREDEDIYEQLETREYIKFPSNPRDLDNKEELGYDYLLNMMIRTLTKKKIAELQNLHDMKETEYNELIEIEVIDIWKNDLEKFKKVYEKQMSEYMEEMNNAESVSNGGSKKKKAKRTRKTKK